MTKDVKYDKILLITLGWYAVEKRFDLFVQLISSLNKYIRKIKTEELSEFNLKGTHVMCIYYIDKFSKITAKELCDLTGEDKAAISRALDYLEGEGFIQHEIDELKRYKTPYVFTEKGLSFASRYCGRIDETVENADAGVEEDDKDVMFRALEIINNNLKEICKKYE